MCSKLSNLSSIVSEEGQGLVEYALLIILVAIVIVVALGAMGTSLADTYGNIRNQLPF